MFHRFIVAAIVCLCSFTAQADSGLKNVELRDLYFGEVLYYAYQDLHFDALARLDNELSQYYALDESELDSFHFHLGQAEFSIGDLELQYRMNQRAGKAIQVVLGEGVDLATRNLAALALARVFYKKNEPQNTLYALQLIREEPTRSRYEEKYSLDVLRGREPESFKTDVAYLEALANIDTGRFTMASETLQKLRGEQTLEGYALYNLGIALIQSGKEQEGLAVLDELGQKEFSDNDLLALKDKTNLKLAYRYLDKGIGDQAQKYFSRVRLDGPFSNRALLGAGWVAASKEQYDKALVPWTMLYQRAQTNDSVQEALMAVPYAYGKLGVYGKSANMYSQSMDIIASEIDSLDNSIKAIRKGKFLTAMLNENADKDKNWVVNLRDLPDTPETRYILELMAQHDFQESYKNYRDLAELRLHIDRWLENLRVYEEMIDIRRAYQEPLLPVVEKEFKKLDTRVRLRLEQRDNLASKIKNLLIAPRPEYLATSTERQAMDVLAALDHFQATDPSVITPQLQQKIDRVKGLVHWNTRTEYDQRLTDAYNNLTELDKHIKALKTRYKSFVRTRQAATQSYEGYTTPIRQLRTRLFASQRKLKAVMARQGRVLETMAINELDRRRKKLEEYQIKARFALAESYDRATKASVDEEIERQRQLQEQSQNPENTEQPAVQEQSDSGEQKSLEDQLKEKEDAASKPASSGKTSRFKEQLLGR